MLVSACFSGYDPQPGRKPEEACAAKWSRSHYVSLTAESQGRDSQILPVLARSECSSRTPLLPPETQWS